MADSPQNVYARNLSSHHGYPLRTPEPNSALPDSYRRGGLKIGDVGFVVPDEGSFDVFFNITLPQEHPLHAANGVPNNFIQIQLALEDYRITPDAENPGRVMSPCTVECAITCTDPFLVDGTTRRLTDHQFGLHKNEGAMLILPQGAERHRLAKDLLLLDVVLKNAVDWYCFARERLRRDISNDALYLITGFHKTQSWSLASFKDTGASSARCKIVQARKGGPMLFDDSTWETVRPLEWRIGPRHYVEHPNQSVFITGFKIAINTELLCMQRVTVKVGHSKRTLATTFVGFGASLANLLPWASTRVMHSSESTSVEEANEAEVEHDSSGDAPELVKVKRVPAVSQPFHPSDVINRYLLKKEPSAKIAVTHDSQWITLLEKGILNQQEMLQEGRLEAAVSREYNIIIKDGAVYLQSIGPRRDPRTQVNIVFVGETGSGKSSTINLLLKTGPFATVHDDARPCTQAIACYETTIDGMKYNLWDTRGLGEERGFFRSVFGIPEKDLKKFLKERHSRQEIDLLVFCIRGSRAIGAGRDHYKRFCAVTRRLAAPVIVVVTHLEKEVDMEDWWSRNSSHLKELEMEFDDHVCLTALQGHRRLDESRAKLVEMITRNRHWEPVDTPPRKGLGLSRVFGTTGKANINEESLSRCSSHDPVGFAPSAGHSSYYTANSPALSSPPSPVVEPPTPRSATTSIQVPHINTNLLRAGDRPQPEPPSVETSSAGDSLQSMFHDSSPSSYTSNSDVYLESCAEGANDTPRELPTATVRRKKAWASGTGAFGDVWECDLISGKSSRMVAVKAVRIHTSGNGYEGLRSHEKKLRGELKIWGRLRHRNIVPLLGVVSGFGPLPSTVSPWFSNGSLSIFLAHHHSSKSEKHRLLGDIAVGLRYLHSQGVIHGDLHSDNVLIDDDGTACITDFGLSFISDFVGTSYLKSTVCGGVHFADPALVQRAYTSQDNVFYPTKPCDIYAFGGLMFHVLSGKKPFDGMPSPTLLLTVMKGERPQLPTHDKQMTPWHKSLIRVCWDPDEGKRPPIEELARRFDRQ